MFFGMNPRADLLLAVVGLRKHDVQRFRDVHASADGAALVICTRTGGGNRDDYPNLAMRGRPEWRTSRDDEGDSTYCTDIMEIPETWRADVVALDDLLAHGMRPEFARHLALTLRREPTKHDREVSAEDEEARALRGAKHSLANGHTFVPHNDGAMETALKAAESNDGELRSVVFGIMPLKLTVTRDREEYGSYTRAEIGYEWEIDEPYWARCQKRWAQKYPKAMAKIQESVDRQMAQARR